MPPAAGIERAAVELAYRATVAELARTGRVRARVGTPSMKPFVWPQARVWIERCEPGSLGIGDLVVFVREDGLPCLHRVVGREGGRLRTAGDGNPHLDPPIGPEQVVGSVRGVVIGRWHFEAVPAWAARLVHRGVLAVLPAMRAARSMRRQWRARRA